MFYKGKSIAFGGAFCNIIRIVEDANPYKRVVQNTAMIEQEKPPSFRLGGFVLIKLNLQENV